MAYFVKVFKDFDHCHNIETNTDKWCKDCDEHQRQLCECEATFSDNKPIKVPAKK